MNTQLDLPIQYVNVSIDVMDVFSFQVHEPTAKMQIGTELVFRFVWTDDALLNESFACSGPDAISIPGLSWTRGLDTETIVRPTNLRPAFTVINVTGSTTTWALAYIASVDRSERWLYNRCERHVLCTPSERHVL